MMLQWELFKCFQCL